MLKLFICLVYFLDPMKVMKRDFAKQDLQECKKIGRYLISKMQAFHATRVKKFHLLHDSVYIMISLRPYYIQFVKTKNGKKRTHNYNNFHYRISFFYMYIEKQTFKVICEIFIARSLDFAWEIIRIKNFLFLIGGGGFLKPGYQILKII